MKVSIGCFCILAIMNAVHANNLPRTVTEVEIQIAFLLQQKQLLKRQYQSNLVRQHRGMTQPSEQGAQFQAREFRQKSGRHLGWLARKFAAIDREIANLQAHKSQLLNKKKLAVLESYTVKIVIPKTVVIWQSGNAFVYKMNGSNEILSPVEVGSDVGNGMIEITQGVSLGDVIRVNSRQ